MKLIVQYGGVCGDARYTQCIIRRCIQNISETADMTLMRFGYDLNAKPQGVAEKVPLR